MILPLNTVTDTVRLGLGAPIPKHFYDDDQKLRRDISSVDRFKRRFLGLNRKPTEKPPQHKLKQHNSKKSHVESESEEEEGRSALGKSKRQKIGDTKSPEGGKEKGTKEERKVHPTISGSGMAKQRSSMEGSFTNPVLGDDPYAVTNSLANSGENGPRKKKRKKNYKIDPTP